MTTVVFDRLLQVLRFGCSYQGIAERPAQRPRCATALGRVLVGASRHDSPLSAATLDRLVGLGALSETITVHLDAG